VPQYKEHQVMHTDDITHDAAIDITELLAHVEYDRELLRDLLEVFAEEFPRLQFVLKDALMRQDLVLVQTTAHTLKGMLASLSFTTATASAKSIERMAILGTLDGISEELERLESHVAVAQKKLLVVCSEVAQ